MTDGHVAGFEPGAAAVWVGGEFFSGSGWVAPVFLEDGWAAELDLAGALAASGIDFCVGGDDFARVDVDEACLDGREGPADGGVDAVGEGEAAAECHADFSHAVALEEDVAVAEVGPGGFDGGREGGGAGDVDAHVLRGDGFSGGGLEGGREGFVTGEEAAVDGGNDGEEGDFWSGEFGGAVGGEEW